MIRLTSTVLALLAYTALVAAHPTMYPDVVTMDPMPKDPPILSWHAHIVFMLTDDQIEDALYLRGNTTEHFQEYLGEECLGRFDEGRLCMIRDHDFTKILTEGPFPVGEWSMFIPVSHYALVVPWLLQQRGRFSLLIHPNTGYMYEDHSTWAMWSGDPWPLNLAPEIIGKPHEKSGEFNHHVGDDANPICVDDNTDKHVCGTKKSGPVVPCCEGFTCSCHDSDDSMCYCRGVESFGFGEIDVLKLEA